MRYRIEEPLFTRILPSVRDLRPSRDSLYITGTSVEERSRHIEEWEAAAAGVTFMRVTEASATTITVDVGGRSEPVGLRSELGLRGVLTTVQVSRYYLDITGLAHHVWAPVLRVLRSLNQPTSVVYVEPGDYKSSPSPTESTLFDLSERIEGVMPLPGFAALAARDDEDALFVPLLGFEGARLAFMLETVQPKASNIWPVIGVPGFRPEYPFHTYLGNRLQLAETRAWSNICYARANCPFSLYQVLASLAERNPDRRMKIAPIGTKPHALGAVLYCLDYSHTAELVYDHPVRKAKRTKGTARVCLYDLSLLPPLRGGRDSTAEAA